MSAFISFLFIFANEVLWKFKITYVIHNICLLDSWSKWTIQNTRTSLIAYGLKECYYKILLPNDILNCETAIILQLLLLSIRCNWIWPTVNEKSARTICVQFMISNSVF